MREQLSWEASAVVFLHLKECECKTEGLFHASMSFIILFNQYMYQKLYSSYFLPLYSSLICYGFVSFSL